MRRSMFLPGPVILRRCVFPPSLAIDGSPPQRTRCSGCIPSVPQFAADLLKGYGNKSRGFLGRYASLVIGLTIPVSRKLFYDADCFTAVLVKICVKIRVLGNRPKAA